MKSMISITLNIILFLLVVFLCCIEIGHGVGFYYYKKNVKLVASGAVAALERGNTNLVHEALSGLCRNADDIALYTAGKKLGVINFTAVQNNR